MLPSFFTFTRYDTDPTPGLARQWWALTATPASPVISAVFIHLGLTRLYRAGLRDDRMEK